MTDTIASPPPILSAFKKIFLTQRKRCFPARLFLFQFPKYAKTLGFHSSRVSLTPHKRFQYRNISIMLRAHKDAKLCWEEKSLVKRAVCREEKQMERAETSDVETWLVSDSHLKHNWLTYHSPKLVRKAKPFVTFATTDLPSDHSRSRRKKAHHFLSLPGFQGPDTRHRHVCNWHGYFISTSILKQ